MPYKTHSYYLRKHLRDYFSPPHTQESALVELEGRLQGVDECVNDYILAIQSIAARCGFSADEARVRLLHRIKTGIRNKHVRMKMRSEASLTYDTAIKIATDAEILAA